MKDYMKCGKRYEHINDHCGYTHNLSSCKKESLLISFSRQIIFRVFASREKEGGGKSSGKICRQGLETKAAGAIEDLEK